jgi:hypothetical protein
MGGDAYMKRVQCFKYEESSIYPGRYVIRPIHENFFLISTDGSFSVICARLFGITYPDYLRMCRDHFDAEIVGKGSSYPVAYFPLSNKLFTLVDTLNSIANLVLWERENPNFEKHQEYVKKNNPNFYKEVVDNVYNSRKA